MLISVLYFCHGSARVEANFETMTVATALTDLLWRLMLSSKANATFCSALESCSFFFDVQSCTSGLKTQASCSRATMTIKGMENHLIGGDAERAGTLQPGEEESLGNLINVYKYVKGRNEKGVKLFLLACSEMTNRHDKKAVGTNKELQFGTCIFSSISGPQWKILMLTLHSLILPYTALILQRLLYFHYMHKLHQNLMSSFSGL